MNWLRRELIKAYFESTWHEEDLGLDYVSRELVLGLDKFLESVKEYKNITLTGKGSYIQCEKNMMPPIGFVIDGEDVKDGASLEVMIETDKFCNVENVWWERV